MSAQVAQMPPSSVHSSVAQLVDGLPPGADGAGEDSSRSSLQQDKKKGIGAGYRAAQGLMIMFQTMPPAATIAAGALACADEVMLPLYLTLPLMAEAAHYLISTFSTRAFTGKSKTIPKRSAESQKALWRQCLDEPTLSCEAFITGWFAPVDRAATPHDGEEITVSLSELRRENVLEWLSYALYALPMNALSDEQHELLDECISMLEARLSREQRAKARRRSQSLAAAGASGASLDAELDAAALRADAPREAFRFRFPAGHNKALRSMRLNLDPPAHNMQLRPLFYYALTDGLLCGVVSPMLMKNKGFSFHRTGRRQDSPDGHEGPTYWYHPGPAPAAAPPATPAAAPAAPHPAAAAAAAAPLVFVHGVGLGPLPYTGFIDDMLKRANGAPMMVIELPFVSQRLSGLNHAPHEDRTTDAIEEALHRHGIQSATFVGHSLGTIYLAWLARLKPHLLASCVFIDPIVFLLHHHKVAQSFLYSRPLKQDAKAKVERFFVKSEHSVVAYFHRHFYWFANILWAEQLKAPTAVILSRNDTIVPVDAVEQYLSGRDGVKGRRSAVRRVTTLEDQRHGQFLVDREAREAVLATIADAQRWGARRAAADQRRLVRVPVRVARAALSGARRVVSGAATACAACGGVAAPPPPTTPRRLCQCGSPHASPHDVATRTARCALPPRRCCHAGPA